MKNHETLNWKLRQDRRLIGRRGGARHLLVEVEAPARKREDDETEPPLNVALVIDASGSMSGPPLDMARKAAAGVIETLTGDDTFSLVSFADETIVHVDAVAADREGKRLALDALRKLGPRGCTDLEGGWRVGATCVEKASRPGSQNRVIVLSDGHANRGVTDPEMLGLKAAAARKRGVFSSAVGVGDGYSPTQLNALSEHGGGRTHRASGPDEIVEVVLGELGEIRSTAADDLTLVVDHPAGVAVRPLGPFPTVPGDDATEIAMGTLVCGAERRVVLRVESGEGEVGEDVVLTLRPSWRDADGANVKGAPMKAVLHRVEAVELAAEAPDGPTAGAVARIWKEDLVLKATTMIEDGAQDGAVQMLKDVLREFRDYCRELPDGRELVLSLVRFKRRLGRPVDAWLMCEANTMAMKFMKCEVDVRQDFVAEDIAKELGL